MPVIKHEYMSGYYAEVSCLLQIEFTPYELHLDYPNVCKTKPNVRKYSAKRMVERVLDKNRQTSQRVWLFRREDKPAKEQSVLTYHII